jgi:hypothetical protein
MYAGKVRAMKLGNRRLAFAEVMSLRLAASLMDFCTFFSSLSISAKSADTHQESICVHYDRLDPHAAVL